MKKHGLALRHGCLLGSLLALGCSNGPSEWESDDTVAPASGTPGALTVEASVGSLNVRLRIEEALRDLDRGGDAQAAKRRLEALIAEPTLAESEKGDAKLALSRAFEAIGDEDAAVELVESVLAEQGGENPGPLREAAEKRLRFLLTGVEKESSLSLPPDQGPAPVARALAKLFAPDDDGRVLVDVYAFGPGRGDNHGIFEIAEAKRQELEADMSAGGNVNVGQSITSAGSWVRLPVAMGHMPEDMPQADRSLLVFYYDLGDLRVPSRYDDYLPMPSDDITEVLERGQGLVMARKRASGKPTIVIAAPRRGQLGLVEEAFAKLTEVPFQAVIVPLERKLLPREIQATIRSARSQMIKCYQTALNTDKTLAGKVTHDLVIEADGTLSKNEVTSTIHDVEFKKCLSQVVKGLSFPASGGEKLSVQYPITFSP